MLPKTPTFPWLWLAALVLAEPLAGATDGALRGTLDISIRGSGAAPLGIASAISGTTNFGVGLGRLQTMAEPIEVLPANETYGGSATFTLVPASARRWCLDELEITYQLTDSTRLDYDEGLISDSMRDQGSVRWKRSPGRPCKDAEGSWQGPTGWEPEFDPRMVLELFKAPTAAECDALDARGLFNQARQILWPTEDWATCYELDVFVMHPIRASGRSSWTSGPVQISLDASDGRLRFTADSGFDLDQAQLPKEAPPEAKEFLKAVRGLQDQWQEGFAEFDADHEMAWERKYTGALPEKEDIRQSMIYAILTGATVVERLSLTHLRFVLDKAPESWRPVPRTYLFGDNQVDITARVAGPKPRPVRWRFTVYETSREPGEFMNDHVSCNYRMPDFLWLDENNPDFEPVRSSGDVLVATTKKPLEEVTLRLESDDGAAWAKVKAEAEIEPGVWIQAEIEGSDLEYITVPRDEEGGENYIADAWEREHGLEPGLDPTTDDESDPAPAQKGDGLTLWEEYRGFEVLEEWQPTDPREKDLFIHFSAGLQKAVSDIELATDLRVHQIETDEFVNTTERVVNVCQGRFSKGKQHGLWVNEVVGETNCEDARIGDAPRGSNARLPCGVAGKALGGPGRPRVVREIIVRGDALNDTVVHEVMHGLDVWHHGNTDNLNREVCRVRAAEEAEEPVFYAEDRRHCDMQAGGKWVEVVIARPHGQHSGDQECPMAYDVAVGYVGLDQVLARRPDGSLEPFNEHYPQWRACTSGDGTHFNADGQQVGGAAEGSCLHRLAISSWGG